MQKGFTLWFTGLPSSGKSTVGKAVEKTLNERGYKVENLDGDEVRSGINRDLGFSKKDRDTNIERLTFISKLLSRNNVVTIVAAISPYREMRDKAREHIENFVEVHVNAPVEVCAERDPKGNYKKAYAGEIKNFTGVDDPYEQPNSPEIVLETHKQTVDESAKSVIDKLEAMGLLEREITQIALPTSLVNKLEMGNVEKYVTKILREKLSDIESEKEDEEDEEEIKKRLESLGYI